MMQSAGGRIAEWRRPLLAHCLGCKRSCELTALGSTEPWLVGKANIYLREHTTSRIFECGQLAQEDLLGRVESVDDEARQLVDLCLEGEGLGLSIFGHCVGRCLHRIMVARELKNRSSQIRLANSAAACALRSRILVRVRCELARARGCLLLRDANRMFPNN